MERSLNNDELYSAKLGLRINKAYDHEVMTHNLSFKASSELASNFTDVSYVKTKIFTRYSKPFEKFNIYAQGSLSGGYIHNLRITPLKVNDTFYLKNFKGIRNVGYHYDNSDPTRGILGENLGFDRFISISGKLY